MTPPAPHSEAAIVAAPVAGHFVPVDIGVAAIRPAPPRGILRSFDIPSTLGATFDVKDRGCKLIGDEKPCTTQLNSARTVIRIEGLIFQPIDGTTK
jgi:hypothetical protein